MSEPTQGRAAHPEWAAYIKEEAAFYGVTQAEISNFILTLYPNARGLLQIDATIDQVRSAVTDNQDKLTAAIAANKKAQHPAAAKAQPSESAAKSTVLNKQQVRDTFTVSMSGKPYFMVAGRILEFGVTYPDWAITTSLVLAQDGEYIVSSQIYDDTGRLRASAMGSASTKNLPAKVRALEKAETAAVGRALAYLGFGTAQAGDDFDDSEHLADSPVDAKE